MPRQAKKVLNRQRVKRRVRAKVTGTAGRPRLSVYRSNQHTYAQLIDDLAGHTLAAASSLEKDVAADDASPTDVAKAVGQRVAERAREAGVETAIFDRNGFRYHGRIRAVAEGAREGGLRF